MVNHKSSRYELDMTEGNIVKQLLIFMVPRPEPAKPVHGHGTGEFYWRTSVPLDL